MLRPSAISGATSTNYDAQQLLRAIARLGTGAAYLRLLSAAILRWFDTSLSSAGVGDSLAALPGLTNPSGPLHAAISI